MTMKSQHGFAILYLAIFLCFTSKHSRVETFAVVASSSSASTFSSKEEQAPGLHMIVVGGSSGMGKAAALETLKHGGKVMLVSRSEEKLQLAKLDLLSKVSKDHAVVETRSLDATDEEAVKDFSSCLVDGTWDSLVITAAGKAVHGPFENLDTADSRYMMESKFWNAYNCAKYIGPKLKYGGSVTFVAGILNRRPGINCVPLAIANGALEGLTRSLALELGPRLRVNCLSPGFTNTERFELMDPVKKQQMLDNTAASLPLQKVGTPQDMGSALYYLATAEFVTGVVLDVDGGHGIRQYASAINDPMRKAS